MMMKHSSIDSLRRNCTLVAAREVTGRSDEEIIAAFLRRGWIPNSGAYDSQYMGAIADLGLELEAVTTKLAGRGSFATRKMYDYWMGDVVEKEVWNPAQYMSLGQFLKAYPVGTYVVSTSAHAFVVRDGHVVDPNYLKECRRRRIKSAWRIMNPAPSRHLASKVLKLPKGDPLVRFVGRSHRSRNQDSFRREMHAVKLSAAAPVRLSFLLKNTPYLRRDAAWDVARGRLVVVSDK